MVEQNCDDDKMALELTVHLPSSALMDSPTCPMVQMGSHRILMAGLDSNCLGCLYTSYASAGLKGSHLLWDKAFIHSQL